ncbi:ATP-binding response regulator [Desertivirga xinjiangensis]|uniref:ATP-binding response regulator n=1 Tax=Desertivirga xinjiangensis TaxID=539206 RepID=UPI00210C201D|nr:ATP-binding protein [Pedobacter xinjiangensis]
MILSDEAILNFIRTNYPEQSNYSFSDLKIDIQQRFVVVKDIHEVNEDEIDITKDVFVRGLNPDRQTNSVNIINICDSVAAESHGLDEEIYQELERYNRRYTKAFLRNGSRWVDLGAFNLCAMKARQLYGNLNPRTIFNISKSTYLLNNNLLNTANIRLSLVNLRSCLELMHLEIRKMNYDMIMRPVTTQVLDKGFETLIQTKYINNFGLSRDIHFDHEFQVFGTLAGLVARKNRGVFGNIKPYYYQYDLFKVLTADYSYLGLKVTVGNGVTEPIFVNGKQLAHKALLKRKGVNANFSSSSKLTGKLLASYKFHKYSDIYDYTSPVELDQVNKGELDNLISSRDGIVVYLVDETLFDSYSIYDTINPRSGIVVEKGEVFNAPYNLFGINYVNKNSARNLWKVWDQILLFSKTNKSDQLERIKLFDSLMMQQKNAIARAEQAERLVKDLQESNDRIHDLNETLTLKVAERTQQLEKANELQRNTFVNLVHETRTPLTIANNYLEEYIEKYGSVEELEIIKAAVNKFTMDMTALFDIERYNRGLEIYKHDKECNFSEILQESWLLFEPYLKKRNLRFDSHIEPNIFITADPIALNRLINNLIDNGIKYSFDEGLVSVLLLKVGDRVEFTVKDTGRGIPRKLQKKIFEPYYQINHEKESFQGMGLGLPIVKKVIDSLRGEIAIDSNPASYAGTTVTVSLPYSVEAPVRAKGSERIAAGSISEPLLDNLKISIQEHKKDRHNLLVVEDNVLMLNYLNNKLSLEYNVHTASNGVEAIKTLQGLEALPSLIVSDIMMDRMDGYEFAKVLSENKRLAHIPIIFLTAKNTAIDKLKGLQLGAVDFINKPYSFGELRLKIEAIISKISIPARAQLAGEPSTLQDRYYDRFEENCTKYRLTKREVEIAVLVMDGLNSFEIADKLNIAERTVTTHFHNIYQKLDVSGRLEMIKKLQGSL